MKNVANRLIVFAASSLAFGTTAFGQGRITAEIPFAFHTATGTLPAGTYHIDRLKMNGLENMVFLQNTATLQALTPGSPVFNPYVKTELATAKLDFVCLAGECSLRAIRTSKGSLEYAAPKVRRRNKESVAVISIPAKMSNAE